MQYALASYEYEVSQNEVSIHYSLIEQTVFFLLLYMCIIRLLMHMHFMISYFYLLVIHICLH